VGSRIGESEAARDGTRRAHGAFVLRALWRGVFAARRELHALPGSFLKTADCWSWDWSLTAADWGWICDWADPIGAGSVVELTRLVPWEGLAAPEGR